MTWSNGLQQQLGEQHSKTPAQQQLLLKTTKLPQ
jgi:hypothetical protein